MTDDFVEYDVSCVHLKDIERNERREFALGGGMIVDLSPNHSHNEYVTLLLCPVCASIVRDKILTGILTPKLNSYGMRL